MKQIQWAKKIAINLLKNIDYVEEYNKKVCESRDKIKKRAFKLTIKSIHILQIFFLLNLKVNVCEILSIKFSSIGKFIQKLITEMT